MKEYKTLLFDLDDTLIDNKECIKYAFSEVLKYLNIPYSDEMANNWYEHDTLYWHSWESGNLVIPSNIKTTEQKVIFLRTNRFVKFFNNLDFNIKELVTINDLYCKMLGENIVEIEDASKTIKDLANNYELVIATNGAKEAALKKINKLNITDYISNVLASEEIGFGKPQPQYFDALLNITLNKDKSKMLIIGDGLTTDILGGINNNIDTCWFNKNNIELNDEYKPTYTINKLLELKKILK